MKNNDLSYNATSARYGYNGTHEQDKELNAYGNYLDFGNFGYDTRVAMRRNQEPLRAKYPNLSGYSAFGSNPIMYSDLDGNDLYMLFYTSGNDGKGDDELFHAAALTRKKDIESRKGFDRTKDKVVVIAIKDMATIQKQVNKTVQELSSQYGQTQEFSIWSHAAFDGPRGTKNTSTNAKDKTQMLLTGWGNIDFN